MKDSSIKRRVQAGITYIKNLLIHHHRALLLLLGVFVPLQIFGELAEDIWENEGGFPWDKPILLAIYSTASPQLDHFASTLTQFGFL
ncbi:MAG: hypothetical protein VKK04_17545 [Synechococcales bacterium]|nr:hypothetical protein [Synechococcales bacterium]